VDLPISTSQCVATIVEALQMMVELSSVFLKHALMSWQYALNDWSEE